MSVVSNLLVVAGREDADVVESLSSWLQADAPRRGFETAAFGVGFLRLITDPVSNQWGGYKNPECQVWAAALNHADLDAVLRFAVSLPWRFPGRIQLLLMDQEQTYFRLYMISDGEFRQYAPDPVPDADEQHAW